MPKKINKDFGKQIKNLPISNTASGSNQTKNKAKFVIKIWRKCSKDTLKIIFCQAIGPTETK